MAGSVINLLERPEPKVYKARIFESCEPWPSNIPRHTWKANKEDEEKINRPPKRYNDSSDNSSGEDNKKKELKEHFDSWLQRKIIKEKEIKQKKKYAQDAINKINRDKEEVKKQLNEIMKEEWLKKKSAQQKEEKERKRQEKEKEEMEKTKKEIISKIKVNNWMVNRSKKVGRPVDQSLYSANEDHIGFFNPEPWKSNLE